MAKLRSTLAKEEATLSPPITKQDPFKGILDSFEVYYKELKSKIWALQEKKVWQEEEIQRAQELWWVEKEKNKELAKLLEGALDSKKIYMNELVSLLENMRYVIRTQSEIDFLNM